MQLIVAMRKVMLDDLRTALINPSLPRPFASNTASQTIKFYTSTNDLLCSVDFSDLINNTVSNLVSYKFLSIDGISYQLRSSAIMPGQVSYFLIDGVVNGNYVSNLIQGIVGGLGSASDIQFNRIDWTSNTTITLTDLSLVMS